MVSEKGMERRMKWDKLMEAYSRKRELSISSYALNVFFILIASNFITDIWIAFHTNIVMGAIYLICGVVFTFVYVLHFTEMFKLREEV